MTLVRYNYDRYQSLLLIMILQYVAFFIDKTISCVVQIAQIDDQKFAPNCPSLSSVAVHRCKTVHRSTQRHNNWSLISNCPICSKLYTNLLLGVITFRTYGTVVFCPDHLCFTYISSLRDFIKITI